MIVEAVAIAVISYDPAKQQLCEQMQSAMTKAVEDALAEGVLISDSVEIKKRIDAARDKFNV